MSTPQQRGIEWETRWMTLVGGRPTPGSGSQWYAKSDVRGKTILWSCKHTDFKTYPLGRDELQEVATQARGPGGTGGGRLPAMAIRIAGCGEEVVVMRVSDFLELMSSEQDLGLPADKVRTRLQRARVPGLLRDTDG